MDDLPGQPRRLAAALASGRRRIWVSAPRMTYTVLGTVAQEASGTGCVAVDPHTPLPAIDDSTDLLVHDPHLLADDAVAHLASAAPRSLVVLAPPRATRGSSPLFDAVQRGGVVLEPEPESDGAELEQWVMNRTGADPDTAAAIMASAGDLPHLTVALTDDIVLAELEAAGSAIGADDWPLGRHQTTLGQDLVRRLTTDVVSTLEHLATDPTTEASPSAVTVLDDEGVLDRRGRVPESLARAITTALPPGRRRELTEEVVERYRTSTSSAEAAARALDRLGERPTDATPLLIEAAESIVDRDPDQALAWLDDSDGAAVAPTRLRALVASGRMSDAVQLAGSAIDRGDDRLLPRLVTAAGLAHAARFSASADAYALVDDPSGTDRLSAVPRAAICAVGSIETGGPSVGAIAVGTFAHACSTTVTDPAQGLELLIDATELATGADAVLWPDAPHVPAALVASTLLHHDHATQLLRDGTDSQVGGAALRTRLTATRGWVALRAGRWSEAADVIEDLADAPLALRERLLLAGLRVALAHRQGDTTRLAELVDEAVTVVRRHPVDLYSLFAHAEIAVAAARLGQVAAADRLLDQLDARVADTSPTWAGTAGWFRLMAALCGGDADRIAATAEAIPATPGPTAEAVEAATRITELDGDRLDRVCRDLLDAGLVFEASLLAGAAALAADTATAKPMLRLARELRGRLPRGIADEASGIGALSDRELEVARELIEGRTYKEIGARLFISAKTVEHHVAHVKTKLGAGSRAELLATLRAGLE